MTTGRLTCTGTTGRLVEQAMRSRFEKADLPRDFKVLKLRSGPLGGDQQLGALITEVKVDFVIMISSPLMEQEYNPIVKDYSGCLRGEIR